MGEKAAVLDGGRASHPDAASFQHPERRTVQWLARLIGSSELGDLNAPSNALTTALRLPELDEALTQISNLTGSCARLFAVLALEDGPLAVQVACSANRTDRLQPLCDLALKLDAAGVQPICLFHAQQSAIAATSSTAPATAAHGCPVATDALVVVPISTPEPRLALAVVTGLLHPADIHTTDVLASELRCDEAWAQELTASIPSAVAGWKQTEDFVAQLVKAVGSLAVVGLQQRGLFAGDAEREATFSLIEQNARLANALSEVRAERGLQQHHLAMLVHDMRTPLSAILGHVELIQLGIHGPVGERQLQALQGIHHRARGVLEMVGDILDYARARDRKVRPNLTRFPLADVARRAMATVQIESGNKGLELQVRFEDDTTTLEIVSAELRLEQILVNLLGNAVKYTDQGSVALHLSHPNPGWVEFAVQDTGIGVPKSEQALIFLPYTRASTNANRQGAGLGLALCRAFVERLGGTLRIHSEAGRGSTFTLRLPVEGHLHEEP